VQFEGRTRSHELLLVLDRSSLGQLMLEPPPGQRRSPSPDTEHGYPEDRKKSGRMLGEGRLGVEVGRPLLGEKGAFAMLPLAGVADPMYRAAHAFLRAANDFVAEIVPQPHSLLSSAACASGRSDAAWTRPTCHPKAICQILTCPPAAAHCRVADPVLGTLAVSPCLLCVS
jgi:hypothetical protein